MKTRETYGASCHKNTANINFSVRRNKKNRLVLVSNCCICGERKS